MTSFLKRINILRVLSLINCIIVSLMRYLVETPVKSLILTDFILRLVFTDIYITYSNITYCIFECKKMALIFYRKGH